MKNYIKIHFYHTKKRIMHHGKWYKHNIFSNHIRVIETQDLIILCQTCNPWFSEEIFWIFLNIKFEKFIAESFIFTHLVRFFITMIFLRIYKDNIFSQYKRTWKFLASFNKNEIVKLKITINFKMVLHNEVQYFSLPDLI